MGVPLLVALLGPAAAGPAILTILVDMVFTSSLCIALSRLGDGQVVSGAASQALRNALKGVLTNPLPWAILLGAAVSAWQLRIPQPMVQTVGLLADAASPVALFTIGAVLARSEMLSRAGHAPPTHWREYMPVAAMKLLLHPLLVWSVGTLVLALGMPLDTFSFKVLVLLAALPSASNVSMLAERFGADNGRIARIILVSTVAAFITFSAAVTLLA
jgi:predicted permease